MRDYQNLNVSRLSSLCSNIGSHYEMKVICMKFYLSLQSVSPFPYKATNSFLCVFIAPDLEEIGYFAVFFGWVLCIKENTVASQKVSKVERKNFP